MRTHPLVWTLGACVLVSFLSGCHAVRVIERFSSGETEHSGSGTKKTETRTVASFHRIELDGAADLTITVGPEVSVEVASDDNLIPLITTTVDGDTLTVATTESFSTKLGMKVAITVPSLKGLQIRGAGDVRVEGVKGALFEATIQGSGDLVVAGTVDRSVAEITGAGDIDFSALLAKTSEVSISGAGNVRTYASETLKAQIRGSGDISYLGHPKKVEPSILGSGDIKSLD